LEITNSKTVRINFASLFLIGSGSLGLLGLTLYMLLVNIYGRFEPVDIISAVKHLKFFQSKPDYSAAILFSKYSDQLSNESSWYSNNIATWKKFAKNSGVNLQIVDDKEIESGNFQKYQLLILPTSKALSNAEIIQIKQYLENGGNIFATNSTAIFDEFGKWRGWKFFNEVYGIKFVSEFPPEKITRKQSFRGGSLLTAGIPSGFSLPVATWDSPMACQVLEPRTTQIGFWNNFPSESNFIAGRVDNMASAVCGNYGKGKFVWMGFNINSVYGEQEEYIIFERFIRNTLNWLTEKPVIFVKDWPSDYKAAMVINVIGNSDLSNYQNIISYVQKYSLPVTFYVDPDNARENVPQLKMLSRYGDIGSLVTLGNLTSAGRIIYQLDNFKGQYMKLKEAKENLGELTDKNIISAMPAFGNYDENTINALAANNYEILLTDSLFNKSVPNSIIKGDDQVIAFNKTAYNSIEIDSKFGIKDLDYQLSTYENDIDRVVFEGGLYNLNIHSSIWSNPGYNKLFDGLFGYVKNKGIWLTSSDQIKKWWIAKNSIEVGIKAISDRRISFLITNPSKQFINNLIVEIDINKNIDNLAISSEIIGTEIPNYFFDKDNEKLFLKLHNLNPGQTNYYFIDFDNVVL
jgi:hypothetical protein